MSPLGVLQFILGGVECKTRELKCHAPQRRGGGGTYSYVLLTWQLLSYSDVCKEVNVGV